MYTPIGETFGILDALLVSVVAILIVFLVLSVIIAIASVFSSVINKVDRKRNINPRPENKLLEEDEDAVAALLVATMDYYRETKKEARLVKISLIDKE